VSGQLEARHVYRFGVGVTDGRSAMKDLLGGKGANLAEMAFAGLPVPPGFTITTEVCAHVAEGFAGGTAKGNTELSLPEWLWPEIDAAMHEVERTVDARFGDPDRPLLVSVRSGAAISMPGMMDTVLNLGLNDEVCEGLARRTGKARFAWDAYRRFLQMFGDVVMGVPRSEFEHALDAVKASVGARTDQELDEAALRDAVNRFKAIYRKHTGHMFPSSPREQLERAILAVFASWNGDRARKYREVQKIRGLKGTAVNVQAMVFGNTGPRSGTGVLFTRNPATGAKELYGEYLVDAQGEDVVAGTRTPSPIAKLHEDMPEVHEQLVQLAARLESHFKNVQDVEFTVQDGRLYLLQTRHGKRTGAAAVKHRRRPRRARGSCTKEEAVANLVEPGHVDQLLHPHFADEAGYRKQGRVLSKGLAASPGAAVGRVVFHAEDAESWKAQAARR
jgi:pyruvate,orthophosphate dikinase